MKNDAPRLLFVDDDPLFLDSIKATFRRRYQVESFTSPFAALVALEEGGRYAVIVSDMRMPGMNGVDFLKQAATFDPDALRIMLTGHADLDTAMAAVNDGGVTHFLTKPCPTENLRETIDTCVIAHAERTGKALAGTAHSEPLDRFIGQSASARKLRSILTRLAQADVTVLFTGESGTGKSLVAEILHSISDRREGPFVRVNCPSLSEGVFGAELFGSVRGAYTGSVQDSKGRFSAAEGGSILLDEIGDVPYALQSKLLQVIERKEFERVGDHKTIRADVRIMAATNMDLERQVAAGAFRKDLFYRLNVMPLALPPLRERPEDIPLLADAFLAEQAARLGRPSLALSEQAMSLLKGHDWPGNVRELRHCLERAATLAGTDSIQPEDLPANLLHGGNSAETGAPASMDRERLIAALKEAGWNKARAARDLGMSRSSLYRKLREEGISPDESMN